MDIISYLLGLYSNFSPSMSTAALTCTINGQQVECPTWLNNWFAPLMGMYFIFVFAIVILCFASMWRLFAKAGKPGWAAIIPVYNMVVMLDVVKKPLWWIILMFIPFVNVIISIIVMYNLAKVFGKGIGFTIGLIIIPIIFYPVLAFGKSVYQQPAVV